MVTLFTPELGEIIMGYYIEGMSLHKISQLDGMPNYNTLLRWIRDSDKFKDQFEGARRARAIHMEEKALELAESYIDKDDVGGARLKFDILKWGAEVHDAGRYGKKVTVGGDAGRPIVIQVTTGVPEPVAHQKGIALTKDGMPVLEAAYSVVPVPVPVEAEVTEPPIGHPGDESRQESLFDRLYAEKLAQVAGDAIAEEVKSDPGEIKEPSQGLNSDEEHA